MYQNEYIFTKQYTREYVKGVLAKFMILEGLLVLVVGMIFLIMTNSVTMMIIVLFGAYAAFLYPELIVRQLYESAKNMHQGMTNLKRTISFEEKGIIFDEGEEHKEIAYKDIKKIKETRHLYALMTGRATGIVVLKSGFTKGDPDEFADFVKLKKAGF